MYTCRGCGKPEGEVTFGLRDNGKPQSLCRGCMRNYSKSHYSRNKTSHNERRYQHKIISRSKLRALIQAAKNKPCADCHIAYPYWIMQFDHVRGEKEINIGELSRVDWSEERVLKEIEKCEVVCANCHADRTYRRHLGVAQLG